MKPDQCKSAQVVRRGDPMSEPGDCGSVLGTAPNRIRIVQLRRRGNAALGFSIRGGREHGTGVFVSHVTPGSESHHRGLKVGDQIIRINGYPIDHFVHEEVLALLKARPSIVLKVKSVGMIPIKDNKRDPITWKLVEPEQCSSGSDGTHSVSSGSSLEEPVETKVFISGIGSSSLGCSVVKGPPEIPGIFVQTVKPHGLAEMAGLEIGDQITEVNGRTFDNLEFAEAIAMLKSFKEMALTVKKGAGMELFPEERLRRQTLRVCRNGIARTTNGTDHLCHHNHRVNGNHHYSASNGLQDSGEGSPGSWTSAQGTVTNGSVMSGMSTQSIGGSLSSSQSISPVANGHGSRNGSSVSHRLELCHKHRAAENGGVSQHLSSSEAEERQRLEEEKRRLQEKEEQLKLEAEKLAEERRRLEAQKSVQQNGASNGSVPPPCNLPMPPPQRHVFAELHSVAEKKRLSRENSAQPNGECSRKNQRNGLRPDSAPSQDVLIKQKQHEQLMVEFREVHQKMFGGNATSRVEIIDRDAVLAASKKASSASQSSQSSHYRRRQTRPGPSVDQLPAPPSAVQFERSVSRDAVPRGEAKEFVLPQPTPPTITPNASESLMAKKQWPAYVPPAHPNPHMFIQPSNTQKGMTIGRASLVPEKGKADQLPVNPGREKAKGPAPAPPVSKDTPITDSRGPESKPPRTFFNEKPLVTIGTYPDPNNNPRPNRFVGRAPKVEIIDSDKSLASDKAAKTPDVSSTSLKSCSIPIEKVLPNSNPKMTVSINTKPPNHPSLSTRFSSTPGSIPVNNINSTPSTISNISNNMDVVEGAVVKTLTFKKDGVTNLNLNLEGGLNSIHEGRIIVSEVREGGLVPLDGEIQKGDQLLMVDNTRLVNVSLTAARVALQNAMGSDGKDLKLTIAKLPR